MSSDTPANDASATDPAVIDAPTPADGKGKGKNVPKDDHMEEDEDDDEEDEEELEDEDDEDEEEDLHEIDPKAILAPGARRSTRGNRVDYTSAEALAKAGLKPETPDEDEDDEEAMKDD